MDVPKRRLHLKLKFLFAMTGLSRLPGLCVGTVRNWWPALCLLLMFVAIAGWSGSGCSTVMACALQATDAGDTRHGGERIGDLPGDDVPPSVPGPESSEPGEQSEPLAEMTLEKVLAAFRAREAAVQSFEFTWTTRYPIEVPNAQLRDAATLYPDQFHKSVDGQYLIVKPGYFLRHKRSWYSKDVGNERVVTVTESWDGRESVRLGDPQLPGVGPTAAINVLNNEQFDVRYERISPVVEHTPILVYLLPFAENRGGARGPLVQWIKPDASDFYTLTDRTTEVAGQKCRILEVHYRGPGSIESQIKFAELAIGAGPDYPVLEISLTADPFGSSNSTKRPEERVLLSQTIVWKTVRHPVAKVIPVEWTIKEFDPLNSTDIPRFKTTEVKVTRFEINGDYPNSKFSPRPFPANTLFQRENGTIESSTGIVYAPFNSNSPEARAERRKAEFEELLNNSILFDPTVQIAAIVTFSTIVGYLILSRLWNRKR